MRLSRPILATLALVSACGGGGGDAPVKPPVVPPPTPVVTTVTVSPAQMTIDVGATTTLSASVSDQAGAAMSGQVVSWSSSVATIASVDAASGVVTGVASGTAVVTAAVAGKSGVANIIVVPPAVASVAIAALAGPMTAGQTAQLAVTVKDRNGTVLNGRAIAWTSSATTIASIDNTGRVTAHSAGTTTISAQSEGISGTLVVVVNVAPGAVLPVIADVSPSTLVPGAIVTITGTGFDAIASNNSVRIRGIPAILNSASPTQLTVTIPCVASGAATVQVMTNLVSGPAATYPVAVPVRTLAVGQSLVLADARCNELPASSGTARYLLTLFSVSQAVETVVDFEIGGNAPPAGASVAIPPMQPLIRATEAASPESRRDRAHFDVLEWNRAMYAEGRARAARLPSFSRAITARAPVPVVGDARNFFHLFGTNCQDTLSARIATKVVYAGARAIIWEDTTNALPSSANPEVKDYYDRLGRIFDQDQYDVIKNTFGDPLRRDALTDNDGRVHMVFTQRLNGTGAAAYVTSCDQRPSSVFAASNFGEVFYGAVPTTRGSNLNSTAFPDGWFNFMARTVVHEVKHIASLGARVANNAPVFEQSWLEEGTARHAEEVWVRQYLHKVAWKANTGFGTAASNGIYCDFHPESGACLANDVLRRPGYGMRRHFNEIRNKLREPWNWSLYGDGTGQTGSVFYQTSWSLVRYAIDRYAASDSTFHSTLMNSTTNGISNLASIAGVSADQLLGGWSLALYTDDYPGLSGNPDLQIPTWNFRNIYAGLNTDPTWASTFTAPYLLQPVPLTFGSFASQRPGLRGGANAYFELSGTSTTAQLLHVRNLTGGTASPNLRLAIARLQ